MATDATGTPTPLGIPTYNVNADAPSGNGNNAQMQAIDSLLQARATLAGTPAFTGAPTSTTPTAGDNSTKIATTAFVGAALAAGFTLTDGKNIAVGTTTGTEIGTASTQKLGFFGATPVVQQTAHGFASGFTANSGANVLAASTFTGGIGSSAYTLSDLVAALKNLGFLAA